MHVIETTASQHDGVSADARTDLHDALGRNVRRLRARRGVTRKALAHVADVSERHLASLEAGAGNPSLQILERVARALSCSLAELLDDETADEAERLLIMDLLRGRSVAQLEGARAELTRLFGADGAHDLRRDRIALIGLRGAGKTTLGRALAANLQCPFVNLNERIESLAGCRPEEIHSLYGEAAYRRYELSALQDALASHAQAVIDAPGGIVAEAATFNLLLSSCFTVWLTASPEEHMQRVVQQGDMRPMQGNRRAMDDLRLILQERSPFYAKADMRFDTLGKTEARCAAELIVAVRQAVRSSA